MKILFLRIAWMKYYQGVWDGDQPVEKDVPECFNFQPMNVRFNKETGYQSGEYCLGYYEAAKAGAAEPQIHLERIPGCAGGKKGDMADGVLVVWCAEKRRGETAVVGWYRNAAVSRHFRTLTLQDEKEPADVWFNVFAKSTDCVLLPAKTRSAGQWRLPPAVEGGPDFGEGTIWYPGAERPKPLEGLIQAILAYKGDNWTGLDLDSLE